MDKTLIATTQTTLESYLEQIRPPLDIRSELDIGFNSTGETIEFYEIRPSFLDKSIVQHFPFAKIRYIKSRNLWKLYWKRASGKWNEYQPFPESDDLQAILDCIEEDAYGCFYG